MDEPDIGMYGAEFSSAWIQHLDDFGSFLLRPAESWLERAVRIGVVAFEPGRHGQANSTFCEGMIRTAFTVCNIVTAPFALLGLLLGGAIRSVCSLSKKDITLHSPKNCITAGLTASSIRVLSFNALLMPEFITMRNKHRPSSERVDQIADKLIEKDADVICLQEVFNQESARRLAQKLTEAGYYVARQLSSGPFSLNSGLFIASKYPIKNPQFFPHCVRFGADTMASKGLFLSDIQVGDQKITIANTHLNGGGGYKGLSSYHARMIQAHHIRKTLDEHVQGALIVAGDMNVSPINQGQFDPEYYIAHALYREGLLQPHRFDPNDFSGDLVESITRLYEMAQNNYAAFANETGLNSLERYTDTHLQEGGVLPPLEYDHGIHTYEAAVKGTSVDMDNSDSGWRAHECLLKDARLDHIYVRRDKGLHLDRLELDRMYNQENRILSDHIATEARISLHAV